MLYSSSWRGAKYNLFTIRFPKNASNLVVILRKKRWHLLYGKPFQIVKSGVQKYLETHAPYLSAPVTVTSDSLQKNQRHPRKTREHSTPKREEETAGNHSTPGLSLSLSRFFLCFSFSASDSFVSPYEIPGFVEFPPRGWHGSLGGWQSSSAMTIGWVHSRGRRPPTRYGRLQQPCKVQRGGIGVPLPSTVFSSFRSSGRPRVFSHALSAPRFFSLPLFTSQAPPGSPCPSSSFLVVGGDNSSSASAHTSGWFLCNPPSKRAPTYVHIYIYTHTRVLACAGGG